MISPLIRYLLLLFTLLPCNTFAQEYVKLTGQVNDSAGHPKPGVNVQVTEMRTGTITNDSGYYSIPVQANKIYNVTFSYVGFETVTKEIVVKNTSPVVEIVVLREEIKKIGEVSVLGSQGRSTGIERLNMRDFDRFPNPSENIESFLTTLPGVTSTNELSSQYSVHGGNFDENLVYVNDVEIIRPFLVRSGQQEGLSFTNSQMVSSVSFSSGGFEARYGDKMSSVLDVTYRKPTRNQVKGSVSLLGASVTAENVSKNKKFSQITGVRYKTSKYLLNTFDTKGEYNPTFTDIQSLITYKPHPKLEISFLGNYTQNRYQFVPATRSTNFGTYDSLFSLTIFYEGQELDRYRTAMGAFTTAWSPKYNLNLKLIISDYSTAEHETFDILGQYLINELDNTSGSHTYIDSTLNIGVGGMLDHARNHLWIDALTASHLGIWETGNHTVRWSVQAKREVIQDRLNEWTYIDSAGYSIPNTNSTIVLNNYSNAENNITGYRYSGYLQDTYQFIDAASKWWLNAGIRYNYWTFNKEWLWSPRFRVSWNLGWKHDMIWYAAWGVYYQPPLYREMRDFEGKLNPNIKAQKSIHYVIGNEYNLQIWDRPFKLTTELYYKDLSQLIPYKLNSLRIQYTAKNEAVGYATGLDMKLNGEFVPGLESWLSFSVLKTEENIIGDSYVDENGKTVYPGYYPRPTDQRFNFNLFFQDFLPNNPTLQVHLNLVYGSSLPVSPPNSKRFDITFPMGPYRRVDIGMSKLFKKADDQVKSGILKNFKEVIGSIEVFNLLDMNNKASYLWIRTINNQSNKVNVLAVPNYLTSRRLNVKISFTF